MQPKVQLKVGDVPILGSLFARRSMLALTLVGGALDGTFTAARTASAQSIRANGSADVQVPQGMQVEEIDLCKVFTDVLLKNTIYWLNNNQTANNVDAILNSKMQYADEKTRALIVEATAMGLKQQIIAATPDTSRGATLERDGWEINQTSLIDATIKFIGTVVDNHGWKVAFDQGVLGNTNYLLGGAFKHEMVFTQYMNKIFIPYIQKNPNPAGLDTIKAFRSFGLAN